jgi:hypothetical protein
LKKYYSLILLILSNLLTVLLFSGPGEVTKRKEYPPPLKGGHMRLEVPGKLYFPLEKKNTLVPVSLFDQKGILIIKKAFLFKSIETTIENQSFDLTPNGQSLANFTVDIPIEESWKIAKLPSPFFQFFPFDKENRHPPKKRRAYEIKF